MLPSPHMTRLHYPKPTDVLVPDERLLNLPPDILGKIITAATGRPRGVPLLMIVQQRYTDFIHNPDVSYQYLVLPDPKDGVLDEDRFENENYAFPTYLEILMNYANYDDHTEHPIMFHINGNNDLPWELLESGEEVRDERDDLWFYDFLNEIKKFDADGKATGCFKPSEGVPQVAFRAPPLIRSHIAIIMTVDL